ncbi:5905_t:CDS:2, partial [Gigaspora rosea]
MPGSITVLCYINDYRCNVVKSFQIVEALGIMNSRSLNSPQRILLKGFYNHNSPEEFNLPKFEEGNVVLATGKFRIIEYASEEGNILIPKIILNDLVRLDVNLSCILKFLILINMTVKVRNPLVIKDNDAVMVVTFTDHVDQDPFTIGIDCHYLASVPYLIRITPTIKKNSVLFISGEFILHNNNNYMHVKSMSFSNQQKSLLNSVNIPWKTETTNEATGSRSIAEKITARINANGKNEDSSSVNKIPSGIVEPSPTNSKASTKNEDSLFTSKTSSKTNPSTTNSKNKKKSPTNKNKLLTKPLSEIIKPCTRTRTCRLTDLAKEALANSNEQAATFPTTNLQPEINYIIELSSTKNIQFSNQGTKYHQQSTQLINSKHLPIKCLFFVNQILEIEPLEYGEKTFNINDSDNTLSQSTELQNETLPNVPSTTIWSISTKMREIIDQFENTILHQFSCIPCSICSKLMYPEKAKWILRNPNFQYPIMTAYPTERLITNPNPPANQITVCSSCKCNQTRNYSPYLFQVPPEINSVPLEKRKYLLPIFLHCSLGRTPDTNPFSKYGSLVGTMGYSRNKHTFNLYSEILGAYLNPATESSTNNQTTRPPWFDNSLTNASNWLKENNPYLRTYSRMIPIN